MGDQFSTPDYHGPQYENAKVVYSSSDKETQKLVQDFIREQNKMKKEIETLTTQRNNSQSEVQILKANNINDEELWETKFKKISEVYKEERDKMQYKIQQLTMELHNTRSQNTGNNPKSVQHNSNKAGICNHSTQDMLLQCLVEREKLTIERDLYLQHSERLRKENKVLFEEKENAVSRLSKIAGIQLTKGNTGIADLSDANRPTNLAEMWSALYTDEWSDAFDEMKKKNSKKNENCEIEKELCKIATECYDICKKMENKQMTEIKSHLWDTACCLHEQPDQLVSSAKTTQYHKLQPRDDILKAATMKANPIANSNDLLKNGNIDDKVKAIQQCTEELIAIVHERRKYDKHLLQYVIQKTLQHFDKYNNPIVNGKVITFIKRCTEMCWSMVIKDPPMVLLYDQMEGKLTDRNTFSPYTKGGATIDFVIWPALFLHQNGPILSKGVVQGKENKPTNIAVQDVAANKPTNSTRKDAAAVKSTNKADVATKSLASPTNTIAKEMTIANASKSTTVVIAKTGIADVSTRTAAIPTGNPVVSTIKISTANENLGKPIGSSNIQTGKKQESLSKSVTDKESSISTFKINIGESTRQTDIVNGIVGKLATASTPHEPTKQNSTKEKQNIRQDKLPDSNPMAKSGIKKGDTVGRNRTEQ